MSMTLQDLLYEVGRNEDRIGELHAELTKTREKLNHLMERVHVHLRKLDPHDEAYEAYGRAYWLDEHDALCSMRLRPTYDVVLEPEDPDLVVIRNVPAHGETREDDQRSGYTVNHARYMSLPGETRDFA